MGSIALWTVLVTVTYWLFRIWRVAIPKRPYLFRAGLVVTLALGLVSILQREDASSAYWAIGVAFVFLALSLTGRQRVDDQSIAVGDGMPSFIGVDDQDNPFDSESLVGSRVLLKFFRGHW